MKHIDTNCESLQKPVRIVSGVVEKSQISGINGNILIEQRGEDVSFTGTDLDTKIKTSAKVGNPEVSGDFTVSAQKLNEILNTLKPSDPVVIDITGDKLVLTSPNSRFFLQSLPANEFPNIRNIEAINSVTLPSKVFKHLLAMTNFAMAVKDIRFYLIGVLLVIEGNMIKAVGTDTHRLAYCEQTVDGLDNQNKCDVIIPRKTVKELMRILPDDDTPVKVSISESQIQFDFNGIEFISKLVEGKFPDFQRVLPTKETNPIEIRLNREDLIASLRRVQIMTTEKFHGVRWVFTKGMLQIQSNNSDQEEATQDIPVNWTGENLEIGFNVLYLIDVLTNLKTTEVSFHFSEKPRSVLLTMPDSDSFKYVIMPMRI